MPEDSEIIEMFFSRSEDALTFLQEKYGQLCRKIAYGILKSSEDADECVNTAYMNMWSSIPPARPVSLCAYLCTVVRNCAFQLYKKNSRRTAEESFEELEWIIADESRVRELQDGVELAEMLNSFLEKSKKTDRKLFMARYYYNMSISETAESFSMSETAVKSRLSRMRSRLRSYLAERGVVYE